MRRLVRSAPVLLAVVVSQLALASPANAYDKNDLHTASWASTSIPVQWSFTPEVPTAMRAAIAAGANAWNNLGRAFSFTQVTPDQPDFAAETATVCNLTRNTIHLEPIPNDAQGNVVAAHVRPCGTISRFLLVVNSNVTNWYTGTGHPALGQLDLTSVAAHEFGHATGYLGPLNNGHFLETDPECATGQRYQRQTMCQTVANGEWYGRTLEPQEVRIFSSVYTGTNSYCGYTMYGAIRDKYTGYGGSTGALGCPSIEEYEVRDDGREEDFANGTITYQPSIGTFHVRNAINARWKGLGGVGWAFPRTDEAPLPDGVGYHNHFLAIGEATTCGDGNSRSIYWSSTTGANPVQGDIRARWCALGWEGNAGYPVMGQATTADGIGLYQHFLKLGQAATCGTSGNKSIFWRPQTGAHLVQGGIRQRWCALGWEGGFGFPTTDEVSTPTRPGAFTHFKKYSGSVLVQDGSIYWSAATGSWEVFGAVRSKWSAIGWENSVVGFPAASQTSVAGGVQQIFEFGRIYVKSGPGSHEVHGPVLTRYLTEGGPAGSLGFPRTDVYTPTGGGNDKEVDFEHGSIRYLASANTTIVCPVSCAV